ncbi:hypothetical protein [Corynebacterium atypicum]|uniref:hypothetical protein n=1 Tax=Corynebacterium atypicum TaxID=191610 RepID=UPI00068BDA01|nr:hypothetical protein [Corynebacterium atypicum]
MDGTGVRAPARGEGAGLTGTGFAGLGRAETVAALRRRMQEMARAGGTTLADAAVDPGARALGLGAELEAAVPLQRGEVTEVEECESLVAQLVARASARGLYVGVVGWPELSFAAVADLGGALERVVAVPRPAHPLAVATVLIDGLDLVICRDKGEVVPSVARPLRAKLRAGSAALIVAGARVPAPFARVAAHVSKVSGIGRGVGRIAQLELEVRAQVRGQPPCVSVVRLGAGLGDAGAGSVASGAPGMSAAEAASGGGLEAGATPGAEVARDAPAFRPGLRVV